MKREQLILALIFLCMAIAILTVLDDIHFVLRKLKIVIAYPDASGSLIEGEAIQVPSNEKEEKVI